VANKLIDATSRRVKGYAQSISDKMMVDLTIEANRFGTVDLLRFIAHTQG
jgi:hypothetical protein